MGDELRYEVRKRAAFLTIDREASRNALSEEMIAAFLRLLERAEQDVGVRAVCLTGAGETVFCSGADLAASLAGPGAERMSGARQYAALLKRMAGFGKPLVARINGHCLAGGLGLMLACDLVLARRDACFWTPEVNVGIFPMMVGALLYRNVGRKKALEMVLTGRRVAAPEAAEIGLITRAVAPEDLDREVEELLGQLAARSPIGLRIGKEAFHAMSDLPLEAALDLLCEALGRVAATEDAVEGMTAFLEKRTPDFQGR